MKLESDEDYEKLVELAQNTIDFFAENALEHERTGEMIDRIGLVNFLEGIGMDIDANMILEPRSNPYVRMTAGTKKSRRPTSARQTRLDAWHLASESLDKSVWRE